MKIILGWIVFSSLLSIAIIFKAPDFMPAGEHSSQMISQSAKVELLDEIMSLETINMNILQQKKSELKQGYKDNISNAQFENLPITSLFFALLGLNKLNLILVVIYWLATRKKKAI